MKRVSQAAILALFAGAAVIGLIGRCWSRYKLTLIVSFSIVVAVQVAVRVLIIMGVAR